MRILEKFEIKDKLGVNRVLIVIEKIDNISNQGKILLKGTTKEIIVDEYIVEKFTECFGKQMTTTIGLSTKYKMIDLEDVTEMLLID